MTDTKINLDERYPLATAGALPSSRTYGMTEEALASDNIAEVKMQLTHVWLHYQALEFVLNSLAQPEIADGVRAGIDQFDADPIDAVLRYASVEVTSAAYQTAHAAMSHPDVLTDPQQSLRTLFYGLDHSDPERELSDAALARFFEPGAGE